jgi:hypothetical protein
VEASLWPASATLHKAGREQAHKLAESSVVYTQNKSLCTGALDFEE